MRRWYCGYYRRWYCGYTIEGGTVDIIEGGTVDIIEGGTVDILPAFLDLCLSLSTLGNQNHQDCGLEKMPPFRSCPALLPAAICTVGFLCGLPFITEAGV
jgi:hypothetical protein